MLSFALALSLASAPVLVDQVVAEVDSAVITYSELISQTRLLLLRSGGPRLATADTLSKNLVLAVLRSMVHRELLLGEMRRLQLSGAAQEDVERVVSSIRRCFATDGDFLRFLQRAGFEEAGSEAGGAPESLLAILRAELQVERFLDIRVRLAAIVSEAELYPCFQANERRFAGRSFADVKDELRNILQKQREQEALRTVVEQLSERAQIRYAKDFAPGPLPKEAPKLLCPARTP